jgi:hypothetical protein
VLCDTYRSLLHCWHQTKRIQMGQPKKHLKQMTAQDADLCAGAGAGAGSGSADADDADDDVDAVLGDVAEADDVVVDIAGGKSLPC